ncbi:hypothetical protein [Nocardioides convexus]|uniref:hypothetical protein n=1 Tax=Nocardioides convexus TaxID=2712224 RepID=UPI0024186612|nr:hypothetical protein [Nocardioides convexus]
MSSIPVVVPATKTPTSDVVRSETRDQASAAPPAPGAVGRHDRDRPPPRLPGARHRRQRELPVAGLRGLLHSARHPRRPAADPPG